MSILIEEEWRIPLVEKGNQLIDDGFTRENTFNYVIDLKAKEIVIIAGLDQEPIVNEEIEFNYSFTDFYNPILMPDYYDRKKWFSENKYNLFPQDIEILRKKISTFKKIKNSSKESLKNGIFFYLKSFPQIWISKLAKVFDLDQRVILTIIDELVKEEKVKLHNSNKFSFSSVNYNFLNNEIQFSAEYNYKDELYTLNSEEYGITFKITYLNNIYNEFLSYIEFLVMNVLLEQDNTKLSTKLKLIKSKLEPIINIDRFYKYFDSIEGNNDQDFTES